MASLWVPTAVFPTCLLVLIVSQTHLRPLTAVSASLLDSTPQSAARDIVNSANVKEKLRFISEAKLEVGLNKSDTVAVVVNVDWDTPVNHIGSRFVGITIDDEQVKVNWSTLDFKKVQNMAKALSPAYFRLGGTSADEMTYNFTGQGRDLRQKLLVNGDTDFLLTGTQWKQVNDFARSVGWDLIMDLNALKRNADGTWNADNARQLLTFSANNGYRIAGFELGNEYDLYSRYFNVTVTPEQLARDVASLRQLLNQFPQYTSSFIVGPETAGISQHYFQGFLAAGGAKVVRAASFHSYYFSGQSRETWRFTDVKTMQELAQGLDTVVNYTRAVDPDLPIWLSETSSTYGGGTPGVSDRFVAGFLWLDKLGLCAEKGLEAVIRQDFYGGNYALINKYMDPNPDFFLTILYKNIVMGAAFRATVNLTDVRVYAACAKQFRDGGAVVYILNPQTYSVTFSLPQLQKSTYLTYVLTSSDPGDLYSRFVALNGVTLQLINDDLPPINPAYAAPGPLTLTPHSLAFLVFPSANVASCKT